MKHEILNRNFDYLGGDCYGYSAKCSCGKDITGWSERECEENIIKHLEENKK